MALTAFKLLPLSKQQPVQLGWEALACRRHPSLLSAARRKTASSRAGRSRPAQPTAKRAERWVPQKTPKHRGTKPQAKRVFFQSWKANLLRCCTAWESPVANCEGEAPLLEISGAAVWFIFPGGGLGSQKVTTRSYMWPQHHLAAPPPALKAIKSP